MDELIVAVSASVVSPASLSYITYSDPYDVTGSGGRHCGDLPPRCRQDENAGMTTLQRTTLTAAMSPISD